MNSVCMNSCIQTENESVQTLWAPKNVPKNEQEKKKTVVVW